MKRMLYEVTYTYTDSTGPEVETGVEGRFHVAAYNMDGAVGIAREVLVAHNPILKVEQKGEVWV